MEVLTTHVSLLARLSDVKDREAWIEFTARYGELVRSFCRRRGLPRSDSDDVLQDVLLSLTKAMPGFEYDPQRGRFRSYLKTVTLHAIFRRLRQKGPALALEEVKTHAEAASAEDDVDAHWEIEWRRHHVRTAMKRIAAEFSDLDRLAFTRYALEGGDARETAAELGLSVDQVYQAMSRIVKRLSQLVAEQVREEG